jgi:transposase
MLLLMVKFGGLLLMMGHQSRSESLFYYFRLEDQVAENHLLRLIDRHVNFEFVRAKLKDRYSDGGRPSIDPELLLRMLLVGYLYGVTSERKLVEELRMHLAWRWFTGLGFDQEIPHHSTFSKNRHGRFQESNLFQELFEEIVARCVAAGLVKGKHMSVDGSFIQANADHHSRVPPDQLAEVAKVNHTVREYLVELERENPVEPPVEQQDKVSTTDPDSTYATKGGPARLGYYDNYLVDNASCVIVGVQATPARLSHESVAARDMIERYRERYGYLPQTLAADTTYGNGELLQWLDERGIAGYMRVKENGNGQSDDLYGIDQFTYVPEENCYICPEGKVLKYTGINKRNNTHVYFSTPKRCRECSQKSRCTRGKYRIIAVHTCEEARQRAKARAETPEFAISQRARRKVEALFAELKNYIGLRRLRLRRMRFVREQFYLAATAQNLKRLVRFLSRKATGQMATA